MQFSDIKGFGAKRIEQLKNAGFTKLGDLLSYFPTKYIDTQNLSDLSKCNDGDNVVICACTDEKPKLVFPKRGLNIVKAKFIYDGKSVWLNWFNQRFMVNAVVPQKYYFISGKLKKFKSVYSISAPQLIPFEEGEKGVISVYKPIGKVSSKLISEAIKVAIRSVTVRGYIPENITQKHGLMNLNDAFKTVHFPQNIEKLSLARRTLEIEKITYMLCAYNIIKEKEGVNRAFSYPTGVEKVEEVIKRLPFDLTCAQDKAINEIIRILRSDERLNLLLEGDVGCGKTIIAFLAMYFAVLNGKQAVLIAPTEILASQHYKNAQKFFADKGVELAYLSSSVSKNARIDELKKIVSGRAKCIFGTHSLLSDEVEFSNLSLVVIDEQHRFGVAQRARLENKTKGADSIVISATPIPRTLALTLYGDLNRIIIDEMPARKAKVTTRLVPIEKENAMWEYIKNQADLDGRTFVVAPRIADDEDGVSAESIFEKRAKAFGDKIALLHGKVKDSEKNQIMQDFSDGKIKVLVATTVVEVGIDVPEATTMVVYGAERFGLSQLHQLRGRVGRGEKDAYCFVLSDTENAETKSRIDYFIKTNNGFELAEYDFKMRGAGDFLGYEQHGSVKGYSADPVLIATCKNISDEMLGKDDYKKKIANSLAISTFDYFSEITLN